MAVDHVEPGSVGGLCSLSRCMDLRLFWVTVVEQSASLVVEQGCVAVVNRVRHCC